ncbi:Uncharacterized protein Adt_23667 [Abeliophyllum distichum]|uniref:Putative plant transposon protein domain-containing protein n=1 Tax=Abeliophyllum distichum TaxID=126358 RepID=A0ABD1SBI8_9LAMI
MAPKRKITAQGKGKKKVVKVLLVVDGPKNQQVMEAYHSFKLRKHEKDPLPNEQDMQSVALFLYGRENARLLVNTHFKHDKLTGELRSLHIFICTNINLTTQRTRFTRERARLLYHLARGWKMDLGTHIFEFIKELETIVDSQRTIMFPCLINGIFLEAGVPLFPFKEANSHDAPLNSKTIENLEAKMHARENITHPVLVIQPDNGDHVQVHPAPQPA